MKISLRTALITGSSRGLGRAIAVKLAQEGTGQTIVVDGGSSLMNPDFPLALQVPKWKSMADRTLHQG